MGFLYIFFWYVTKFVYSSNEISICIFNQEKIIHFNVILDSISTSLNLFPPRGELKTHRTTCIFINGLQVLLARLVFIHLWNSNCSYLRFWYIAVFHYCHSWKIVMLNSLMRYKPKRFQRQKTAGKATRETSSSFGFLGRY